MVVDEDLGEQLDGPADRAEGPEDIGGNGDVHIPRASGGGIWSIGL